MDSDQSKLRLQKTDNSNTTIDDRRGDSENSPILQKTSFYQRGELSQGSRVLPPDEALLKEAQLLDFIDFLTVAQWRDIEFIPTIWQQTLEAIGIGGTARVQQSLVNLELSLAFKRLHLEKHTASGKSIALQALMNEISILGHPILRRHPNIIRLEGICWDCYGDSVDPVLVFKKAEHGNLRDFLLSEVGNRIGFEQRLRICSGIGSAVMAMHAFHIIHGDLKPENVLIFKDGAGGYEVKVIDLGYSALSKERAEDSVFRLPISKPWNAPEVTEWDYYFPFIAARRIDSYSFGMICLWTLFRNFFPTTADATSDLSPEKDLNWLQHLKDSDTILEFALKCVEDCDLLTSEQRIGLTEFFGWTLSTDLRTRQLPKEAWDAGKLRLRAQKNSASLQTDKEYEALQPALAVLDSLGILCTDIEGFQRPFGYLDYYTTASDPRSRTEYSILKLADVLPYIVLSDYRLWKHLARCYETRYNDPKHPLESKYDAAFQLALLNELHLVDPKDDNTFLDWLSKSSKTEKELAFEVDKIRKVDSVSFKTLDISYDSINWVEQYRAHGLLEEAQKIFERTGDHLERIFGETHTLVFRLQFSNAKALQVLGNLQLAKDILMKLINAGRKAQKEREIVTARLQLVSVYIDNSQWREAEKEQRSVLESSQRVFGEDSESAFTSAGNLAVIYWNLHDFDKAEKLQSQNLKILERSRGNRHYRTLITMNNLSSTYEYQGRSEEALRMKLEALAISSEINGKDHYYTLAMMNNVANSYRRKGNFKEAEKLDVQVVDARKRQLGENDPITLRAMGNLSSSYALQGRAKEAEPLERHIASALSTQLGPAHVDTLTAHNNLAHTLKDLGQVKEAIDMMTEVVEGRTDVLGSNHPETKKSVRNLQVWLKLPRAQVENMPPA